MGDNSDNADSISSGTNVDPTISTMDRRILHLQLCPGIYQSILDSHHVWVPPFISETPSVKVNRYL